MKILIVYKKSFLESHGGESKGLSQLDAPDRERLIKADHENRRSLGDLTAHLARLGISSDAVSRGSLAAKVYGAQSSIPARVTGAPQNSRKRLLTSCRSGLFKMSDGGRGRRVPACRIAGCRPVNGHGESRVCAWQSLGSWMTASDRW